VTSNLEKVMSGTLLSEKCCCFEEEEEEEVIQVNW